MIAFRRAQIAGSQAARVDNNFLHGNARIYHPDLQNVIAGSSQRVGRLNLADAILDRRFPVSLRVVGQDVDNLRRLVIECDRKSEAASRDEV
jgi:hypothetical protein